MSRDLKMTRDLWSAISNWSHHSEAMLWRMASSWILEMGGEERRLLGEGGELFVEVLVVVEEDDIGDFWFGVVDEGVFDGLGVEEESVTS